MTQITSSIRINAPKDRVWAVLADLGGIQRYNPMVKKSFYNTSEKHGVGAGRVCELLPMGQLEETAVKWSEGQSYTLEVRPLKGMPPMKDVQATLSVSEDGDATVVDLDMSYSLKFGPLGALMDALMVRPQFSKAAPNIIKGLKHFVETGEEVTPQVIKRIDAQGDNATPTYA